MEEKKTTTKQTLILEGVFQKFNRQNTGRFYPANIFNKELKKMLRINKINRII